MYEIVFKKINVNERVQKEMQMKMNEILEKERGCCSFCGRRIHGRYDLVRGRWISCIDPLCFTTGLQLISWLKGEILMTQDVHEFLMKRTLQGIATDVTVTEMRLILERIRQEFSAQ